MTDSMNKDNQDDDFNVSPDKLAKSVGGNIRKINRLPLVIIFFIIVSIAFMFLYIVNSRTGNNTHQNEDIDTALSSDQSIQAIFDGQFNGYTKQGPFQEPTKTAPSRNNPSRFMLNENQEMDNRRNGSFNNVPKEKDKRQESFEFALSDSTKVNIDTDGVRNTNYNQPSNFSSRFPTPENPYSNPNFLKDIHSAFSNNDPNKQGRKEEFIKSGLSDKVIFHRKASKENPFEVKAGTVLPAIMVTGINSDLPGQIIAQISQNVYDTVSGKYLLIPQGSKVLGTYDSQIAYGQNRVLVAWNRVIFPDGSSIDLGNMAGSDQAGYAGFKDKVNKHTGKIFGNAFLLSLISAGMNLSLQGSSAVGSTSLGSAAALTPQQEIASSLAQQLGNVGQEMIRKNMQIQPTITIRPGFRFHIMVNRDIVFGGSY